MKTFFKLLFENKVKYVKDKDKVIRCNYKCIQCNLFRPIIAEL